VFELLDDDVHACQDGPELVAERHPSALSSNLEQEARDVVGRAVRIVAVGGQNLVGGREQGIGREALFLGEGREQRLAQLDNLVEEADI